MSKDLLKMNAKDAFNHLIKNARLIYRRDSEEIAGGVIYGFDVSSKYKNTPYCEIFVLYHNDTVKVVAKTMLKYRPVAKPEQNNFMFGDWN